MRLSDELIKKFLKKHNIEVDKNNKISCELNDILETINDIQKLVEHINTNGINGLDKYL